MQMNRKQIFNSSGTNKFDQHWVLWCQLEIDEMHYIFFECDCLGEPSRFTIIFIAGCSKLTQKKVDGGLETIHVPLQNFFKNFFSFVFVFVHYLVKNPANFSKRTKNTFLRRLKPMVYVFP